MKKLPKNVYVRRESDGDTDYLVADEELAETKPTPPPKRDRDD